MPDTTITQPRTWLISSGRDLAKFIVAHTFDGGAWDEVIRTAHLITPGIAAGRLGFGSEMMAYVEEECPFPRCEWCGFVDCISTCDRPCDETQARTFTDDEIQAEIERA